MNLHIFMKRFLSRGFYKIKIISEIFTKFSEVKDFINESNTL